LARQILKGDGVEHVVAVIILDMIGDKDLNVTVPCNSSHEMVKELFFTAHQQGVCPAFSLGKGSILDDHVSFMLAGMPAIDLIDFNFGSEPGLNDYWHTEEDSLDKLLVKLCKQSGTRFCRWWETHNVH